MGRGLVRVALVISWTPARLLCLWPTKILQMVWDPAKLRAIYLTGNLDLHTTEQRRLERYSSGAGTIGTGRAKAIPRHTNRDDHLDRRANRPKLRFIFVYLLLSIG